MRLIDADALRTKCNELIKFNPTTNRILDLIDNAPTINPSFNLDNITEEEIEKFKIIWQRANSKGLLAINEERPQGDYDEGYKTGYTDALLEVEELCQRKKKLFGAEL